MDLQSLSQLDLFDSPFVTHALNKLTGSKLKNKKREAAETNPSAPSSTPMTDQSSFSPSASELPLPEESSTFSDPSFDSATVYQNLLHGIKTFFQKSKIKQGVIGLSGGIDSSLTLKLCVDALGAEQLTGLLLPELGITSKENVYHAKKLAQYFKVKTINQPINSLIVDFSLLPWKPSSLAQMNTKARLRMLLLYNYANTHDCLVIGTSNKSEILLGYGTKFGDLACDVEIIGELFKTEVFKLSDYLGLPEEIIKKAPTAELTSGQTDEAELGASYADIDPILKNLQNGPEGAIEKGMNPALVHKIWHRVEKNLHKSQMPPSIEI